LVGTDGFGGVLRLVEQFDAEAGKTRRAEGPVITGTALGLAVEEGVPATDIRLQAVKLADAVTKMDDMLLTRPPAIFIRGAAAEEGAENAVLHVKHGHVLVKREFKF
jgi:hypothetical protein